MSDLLIRPLRAGEAGLFESLPDPGLVGFAAFGDSYTAGAYRPEWSWVALRDGVVVARAAWWGGPGDTVPLALDWFDFTDRDAAVRLLLSSGLRAEYSIKVPVGWRTVPAVRREAEKRIEAAGQAGLLPLVERYRYEWTRAFGLPGSAGRLALRPEPDDEAFLDAFRLVHTGTLDAHARRTIAAGGVDAAAREAVELLRWMPSPREWWRLAYTRDGELAGLAVPCRNHSEPVIGYIGVVPAQRGHGYAYDLLAEATHLLVGWGADRIGADTDQDNHPMAAAFARAGYPIVHEHIDLF
ncbi:GNAT family N-acetyltransferase [Actinoplanes sp. NPDC051513]|uniref:GNAT family N-acetyltransferase n=1 Tax=Actinoplanes sp. NPDC051513 TaxID=3363908 RepID=UPI003794CF07